jgi:hypothetical protein
MKESSHYVSVSDVLSEIFEKDQAERIVGHENIDFEKMRANDIARLARGREIYQEYKSKGLQLSGEDLYRLGMLFQHSPHVEDYKIAMELGQLSGEKGYEQGAWLSAAAEDRYLINTAHKQKWGTQFSKESGEWKQLPMQTDEESGITDMMRATKKVPARDQQISVFLARDDI